jgi:uncharacterized membrane protein YhiD involved in acid resistance
MSFRRPRYDRDDEERERRTAIDGDDEQSSPPEEPPRSREREERFSSVRRSAQDAVRRANDRGGSSRSMKLSRAAKKRAILMGAIVAGLAVIAIVVYALVSGTNNSTVKPPAASQPANTTTQPSQTARSQPAPPPPGRESDTGLPIPGLSQTAPATEPVNESWLATAARILLKLALAALLAAMLAYRPRKDMPIMQRNPYVAQTQILLAVVGAAMMMIVGDNAARAFGIFAAASLVRFRTNIRDPKEITVLLVSLGIGLAAGVGRIEVAILLALFVLLMLWVLEYYEPAQVFRAMELTITTRNVNDTDEILKEIFEKRNINAELREVNREDKEDPIGKIVYYVNVSPSVSTDQLSEEVFSSDPDNIDSIEWDQKKSTSYIYR